MSGLFWFIATVGHLGIWAAIFNQIHATSVPRSSRKLSEKIILLVALLPVAIGFIDVIPWNRLGLPMELDLAKRLEAVPGLWPIVRFYGWIAVLAGIFFIVRWGWRKSTWRTPAAVVSDEVSVVHAQSETDPPLLHGWFPIALGWLPFNQVLQIGVRRLTFALDLSPEWNGLKICHISDLHFTGQIDIAYFQRLVELANEFEPDIVFITGDLLDTDRCIDWIESTFGRLKAKHGCYFILGNHDLFVVDQQKYLQTLAVHGCVRVDQGWTSISIGNATLQIAGNELPWYSGAESLPNPGKKSEREFRVLLTHSPDQISWARPYDFDLVLAGHCHGGQIAFPVIGPVICPSRQGVKWACGAFQFDKTLMFVTRGVSGDEPIRVGSRPELVLITVESSA